MWQCNKILLTDEHTLLPDEYAFPEDDKPIGNQGNKSSVDLDADDEADPDPEPYTYMHLLDDVVIIDAAGLAPL